MGYIVPRALHNTFAGNAHLGRVRMTEHSVKSYSFLFRESCGLTAVHITSRRTSVGYTVLPLLPSSSTGSFVVRLILLILTTNITLSLVLVFLLPLSTTIGNVSFSLSKMVYVSLVRLRSCLTKFDMFTMSFREFLVVLTKFLTSVYYMNLVMYRFILP